MTTEVELYERGIENGTVVTSEGQRDANVYISGGRVAVVTEKRLSCAEHVDVQGMLVMPGMVDAHVHFMDPGDLEREDFPTGSAGAARTGVTTVIEHTHSHPVRTEDDLQEKATYLKGRSHVDFALAAHASADRINDAIGVWNAGAAFLKAFTCTTHGIPGMSAAELLALFEGIADVGAVCLVHCEDESITQHAEAALREARRTDPRVVLEWRRREAELAAVSLVGLLARLTSARVVAAHVSHEQAIQLLLRERAPSLYVESCPQYFTLLESEILEHGPLRKFTPPARARDEQELAAMWAAVRRGEVSYISSDHAPSTREQKSAGSIWDVPFGIPGVETTLPLLLDGAHRGEISYEQIVAAYAENPARLYGLYPRKGTIGPESDADLVVVDPRREWVIRNEDIVSRAGWSPYDGRRVTGMPVQTYLRGRLIARDRSVVGEAGCGRFITPRTVTTSDDA